MSKYAILIASAIAAAHVLLSCAIGLGWIVFEGSWGGFVLFVVDFPVSLLMLFLQDRFNPFLMHAIFGTLWWFLIAWLIVRAVLNRTLKVSYR